MNSILDLFQTISSKLGLVTMLLPIAAVLVVRKRNIELKKFLKLFEFYVYFTFIMQLFATILSYNGIHNLFLFRLYLPIHTAIFTFFLLKWLLGKNKNIVLLAGLSIIISGLGDFLTSDSITPPYFMVMFDAILLFVLSFFVSFLNDKKKIYLANEFNFIHIGIYLYSILTLIGFVLSQTGYMSYGFFLQSVAVIISNYYFAWSFICLFRSRG